MKIKANIDKSLISNVKTSCLCLFAIFCVQILLLFFSSLLKISIFDEAQKVSFIFITDILISSIIEEFIFRWYFINKLGKFSFLSIIISSIIFGVLYSNMVAR